jgi:hypothetical protein
VPRFQPSQLFRNSAIALLIFAPNLTLLLAQEQPYVGRYDVFGGYSYFNSPKISLVEHGFHFQAGLRPKRWYSLGFDYSRVVGDLKLTPDLLPAELQHKLGAQLAALAAAGKLPPGYALSVASSSETQTFAAGPQVSFRHWRQFTPFIRPSLGAIREVATPKPGDAIAAGIVKQLAPAGVKTDWQGFYGVGGGVDLNCSKHLVLRVQADLVYDHLFNDILREGRRTVRFSVGPAINFGRNVE